MPSIPKQWLSWIQKNKAKISDGYEEDFVKQVLSKLDVIKPGDVIAQYPFTDSVGKKRYIDFVIRNEEIGYFLPIELDGAYKGSDSQSNQKKWADFLSRQNDLITEVGPLIRFSNSQFFKFSDMVKKKIEDVLDRQRKQKEKMREISQDA